MALKKLYQIYEDWVAKTKLKTASLYFHLAAIIFILIFLPDSQIFFPFFWRLHFCTEGAQGLLKPWRKLESQTPTAN